MSDDPLVEAIWDDRVGERAAGAGDDRMQRAADVCERIGAELRTEADRLEPLLREAGVPLSRLEPIDAPQHHTITWWVPDVAAGERAARVLAGHGFETWDRWKGAALASFRHSADRITTARTDDAATVVVRFRWRPRAPRGLLQRVLTPTAGDWSVSLPTWAWRAYPLVRVARLAAERLGLRARHEATLGPFLATPDALVDPLLDVAAVSADDVVVDLGAGDGRIAIEAALRRGCRAVGVEHDADLVERARARARAAGVADRVAFVVGDARSADLATATVVFMFLPVTALGAILPGVRARLPPGARIVAHEQTRPPANVRADERRAVVGPNALSVAHLWRV